MKIVLATIGSRGDIQPHIALGVALKQAGHDCVIASLQWANTLIESYGLKHVPIGNQIDMDEAVKEIIHQSANNSKGLFAALNFLFDTLRGCHKDLMSIFKDADLIIGHGVVGIPEAEMLQKPHVILSIEPMGLPKLKKKTGFFLTDFIVNIPNRLMTILFGKPYLQYRKDVGAPVYNPDRNYPHPYLAIVPASKLLMKANIQWKPTTEITGYFFADTPSSHQPEKKLQQFLASAERPVFISFGSMIFSKKDQEHIQSILEGTAERTGKKLIALMHHFPDKPELLNNNILMLRSIPYAWLFDKISLVIHHFGFGTTAEVLKAGIPAVPVPFIFDQKIRAKQLFRKNLCGRPLSFKKLSATKLSAAITDALNNKSLQNEAKNAAKFIQQEPGLKKAVQLIETSFS